ncbi:MAG: hypothetical protein ACM3N4_00165 [Nitrososphaerota archaeon]
MAGRYHGKRIVHLENPLARAEREEQRFRRRHDRLHRMRLRHPDIPAMPDADPDAFADVLDDWADLDESGNDNLDEAR